MESTPKPPKKIYTQEEIMAMTDFNEKFQAFKDAFGAAMSGLVDGIGKSMGVDLKKPTEYKY
jgi:hypothetical protein